MWALLVEVFKLLMKGKKISNRAQNAGVSNAFKDSFVSDTDLNLAWKDSNRWRDWN